MPRLIANEDVLIEQNKAGNFLYVRPDIADYAAKSVARNITIDDPKDERGYYASGDNLLIENLDVSGTKYGISFWRSQDVRVEDFTFFDTQNSQTRFASGLIKPDSHNGRIELLRLYGDGEDKNNNKSTIDSSIRPNTDFLTNDSSRKDSNNIIYMRDVTADSFSNSIVDSKGVVYIMNATISDADIMLRAWTGAKIVLVNSVIESGDGRAFAQLVGYNSKIEYYNCLWDGKPIPDKDMILTWQIDRNDHDSVVKKNFVQLDSNPLANIEFFKTDKLQYKAQVSVNGDAWKTVALPNDGFIGSAVGDTLTELPKLGNGDYRVRVWTVDSAGVASKQTITESFKVTDANFGYKPSTSTPPDPKPDTKPDPMPDLEPDTDAGHEIVVHAGGTGGGGVGPMFRVLADGVIVGTGAISDVGTNDERRAGELTIEKFVFKTAAAPSSVVVEYYNDGKAPGGENINFFLDRIIVDGVTIEAETDGRATRAGTGEDLGATDTLFWNGDVRFDVPAPPPAPTHDIVVHAGGAGDSGVGPKFRLLVNGEIVGAGAIRDVGTNDERRAGELTIEAFAFTTDAALSSIVVEYYNDGMAPRGENINFVLDRIVVDGVSIEAEADGRATRADTGESLGATDTLFRNGVIGFDETDWA